MRVLMRRCVDELRYIACFFFFFAWFMGYVLHGAGWGTMVLLQKRDYLGEACGRDVCGRDLMHYSALRLC